jgi:hypothetical protein
VLAVWPPVIEWLPTNQPSQVPTRAAPAMQPLRRADVLPLPELGEVAHPKHAHRQISDADIASAEETHDQQEVVPPVERRVAPLEVMVGLF